MHFCTELNYLKNSIVRIEFLEKFSKKKKPKKKVIVIIELQRIRCILYDNAVTRLSCNETVDIVMGQLTFENVMENGKKTFFIGSTALGEWRTRRVCRKVCVQDQIGSAEYWQIPGGPVSVSATLAVAVAVVFNFTIHLSRINRILRSGNTMNISTNRL